MKPLQLLRSTPLQMIAALLASWVLAPFVPLDFIGFFLGFSLSIKSILIFLIPFMIFSYLFASFSQMRQGSLIFVIFLFGLICSSNFLSTQVAYLAAHFILPSVSIETHSASLVQIEPLFELSIAPLIPNKYALLAGIILGLLNSIVQNNHLKRYGEAARSITDKCLHHFFVPLVPLFVFGFMLKLSAEGLLEDMVKNYGSLMSMLLLLWICYTLFLYLLAANFNPRRCFIYLKNMLTPILAGGAAMSSAAAMPLTYDACRLNTHNDPRVDIIVPSTVNVHLIGDSLGIPLLAVALLLNFGIPIPDYTSYLVFSLYYVTLKFSVAAVPGGGILVMLPLLASELGFTPEMQGLITTIYILADPLFTGTNVAGNGAFAILVCKFKN